MRAVLRNPWPLKGPGALREKKPRKEASEGKLFLGKTKSSHSRSREKTAQKIAGYIREGGGR